MHTFFNIWYVKEFSTNVLYFLSSILEDMNLHENNSINSSLLMLGKTVFQIKCKLDMFIEITFHVVFHSFNL